jgi:hypothetical protein
MKNNIILLAIFLTLSVIGISYAQVPREQATDTKYIEVYKDVDLRSIKDQKLLDRVTEIMASTSLSVSDSLRLSETISQSKEINKRLDKIISLLQAMYDKNNR